MLSFKTFIFESGDSHYQYKKVDIKTPAWSSGSHRYEFKDHQGKTKHIDIHHQSHNDSADVSFQDKHHSDQNSDEKHTLTGDHGHSAIKVLSTVHHVMKQHAKAHPEVKSYEFSSSNDEPSRVKLYSRATKSMGGENETDDKITHHRISSDKLK